MIYSIAVVFFLFLFIFLVYIIKIVFRSLLEKAYENALHGQYKHRAVLLGRLYYRTVASIEKRDEGIENIEEAIAKDLRANIYG